MNHDHQHFDRVVEKMVALGVCAGHVHAAQTLDDWQRNPLAAIDHLLDRIWEGRVDHVKTLIQLVSVAHTHHTPTPSKGT